jgi:FkbM family methyltransferase
LATQLGVRIRSALKDILFKWRCLRRLSVTYSAYNGLLPEVFVRTNSHKLRDLLGLPASSGTTQLNQDLFALLMNRFQPGYFLEIGANDGFEISNTHYLEQHFGWTGLLVEANPRYLPSLTKRRAQIANVAVATTDGTMDFVDAGLYGGLHESPDGTHGRISKSGRHIAVSATTLPNILQQFSAPPTIDFVSIDVEGGELSIVKQMCELAGHRFRCGCIEHNFRADDAERFRRLLVDAGYRVVWEGQTCHDLYFVDSRGGADK